jgi:tRNA G18 (ribose-2'-O)-methylase SpoU
MQTVPVDDFDDPRLADYRNLKDAALAHERGRFIVEGAGTLRVLLGRSQHRPDSILLSERAYAALRNELDAFAPDCPVYVGAQDLLDRVVGFPIHRGCLAACPRPSVDDPLALARAALAREPAPRLLVLEGLTNLDNVGLVFRNAMALGARAVLLCPRCCDPLYRKAVRTSMGGTLCVPWARAHDLPWLLETLRAEGFTLLALDPAAENEGIDGIAAAGPGPSALLLGTEGAGLSPATRAAADRRVRIAMEPGVDSLNVAVAAGIALAYLRRDDGPAAERDGHSTARGRRLEPAEARGRTPRGAIAPTALATAAVEAAAAKGAE